MIPNLTSSQRSSKSVADTAPPKAAGSLLQQRYVMELHWFILNPFV